MTRQTPDTARPGGFRSTIHAAARLLRAWRSRRQSRRTIGTLHGLSDLQLKDIGLHRSEIDRLYRP